MKKILLLGSFLLISCAKPAPVVKVPVNKTIAPSAINAPATVSSKAPQVYLMCSGRLFKAVIVSINGDEVVYRCPDQATKSCDK